MKQVPAKQPLAFRARPRTLAQLKQRARDLGQTQAALVERYIEEGIRADEHPQIWFRDRAGGRRAMLAGTGLDVWQVIATLRDHDNSIADTAAYLEVPETKIRAAVRYYADYQTEIDDWIELARSFAEREERRQQRERRLLG